MSEADALLQEVSAYLKPEDVENIQRAIELSKNAHHGQLRQSGEAYVTHPIAVARILTSQHLDTQAIIAALLHDVSKIPR
jgi:(p)ppGpp synthase/HD superfamily hydrolase